MANPSETTLETIIRLLDSVIYLLPDRIHSTRPSGVLLIVLRFLLVGSLLEGTAILGGGAYELYASGLMESMMQEVRSQHPYWLASGISALVMLFTSGLAAFRQRNKAAYGLVEFLCGMTSVFLLLLITIKAEKPLSDNELIVAFLGSVYLAAEGMSIVNENASPSEPGIASK